MAFERQRPGQGRGDRKGGSEGAPPNPLDHASAEVDQARLAESGAPRGESGDAELSGEPVELAPDQVEGDAAVKRRGEPRDPAVVEEEEARRHKTGVIAFLGHSKDELRRVQWPDRRQVGQATAVVLGFVVLAGGYLGLLDAAVKPIVDAIL